MRKTIEEKYGKLNEDYLLVLKYVANSKEVELGRVPIRSSIRHLDKLKCLYNEPSIELNDIINIMEDLRETDNLDGEYKYCNCENLDDTTDRFIINVSDAIEKINNRYDELIDNPEYSTQNDFSVLNNGAINSVDSWFKAFALQEAYDQLDEDPSIVLYSHRMRGWNAFKNKINDNFSIEINTNFGYGNASYFYTKLNYKGLNLVPFTDWVKYRVAKFTELVQYSSKHELKDKSWNDAINYVSLAYNTYLYSEKEFLKLYVYDELDNFMKELKNLYEANHNTLNNYKFLDAEKKYNEFKEEGHSLIEYKGEKMSGALDLIPLIEALGTYTKTKRFVDEIKVVCRDTLPMLYREVSDIDNNISRLNNVLASHQPEHDRLTKRMSDYRRFRSNLYNKLSQDDRFDNRNQVEREVVNQLQKRYPNHDDFREEHDIFLEMYNKLKADIYTKKGIKHNISNYISKIEKGLGIKSNLNNGHNKSPYTSTPKNVSTVNEDKDYGSYIDDIPMPDISDYPEFANDYSRSNNNRYDEAPIDYSHNEASSEVDDLPF